MNIKGNCIFDCTSTDVCVFCSTSHILPIITRLWVKFHPRYWHRFPILVNVLKIKCINTKSVTKEMLYIYIPRVNTSKILRVVIFLHLWILLHGYKYKNCWNLQVLQNCWTLFTKYIQRYSIHFLSNVYSVNKNWFQTFCLNIKRWIDLAFYCLFCMQ